MENEIITPNSSVQNLDVPEEVKALYKTVLESSQKKSIYMAADRGAFVDKSKSFNVHISDAKFGKATSMCFHGEYDCG